MEVHRAAGTAQAAVARAQHRSAGRAAMRTPLLASARVIGASCWHVARGGHHTRLWPALAYLRRPAAARRVPMTTANKTPARQKAHARPGAGPLRSADHLPMCHVAVISTGLQDTRPP